MMRTSQTRFGFVVAALVMTACKRVPTPPAPLSVSSEVTSASLASAPSASASAGGAAIAEPGLLTAVAFVSSTCVRRVDDAVWCWGPQVWDGWEQRDPNPPVALRRVPALAGARAIGGNPFFLYVLMRDGTVRVWGQARRPDGTKVLASFPTPTPVPGLTGIVEIAGGDLLCARRSNGTVLCWSDRHDEGPDALAPDRLERTAPAQVPGVVGATQIDSGGARACAVVEGGAVLCWGESAPGVFSDPQRIPDLLGVTQIVVESGYNLCVRLGDGTARCGGLNRHGQLGDGTTEKRSRPAPVVGLEHVASIAIIDETTWARVEGGRLFWWGDPRNGAPDESGFLPPFPQTRPVAVPGVQGAVQIAFGPSSRCVLLADSTVRCWGDNRFGQLGDGTTTPSAKPIPLRLPNGG